MIGRASEADAITRFMERVPGGPVGLVIEGEPGIGKTTMWSEAVRMARERGYRVLQARPAEAEADLSFAGLGDLIGGIFDEVTDDLPLPQRQALEVALLRREAEATSDPRTTASGLIGVLTSLSAQTPLVVAVDDEQWLDQASRRALEFVARRLPPRLGIVVASRAEGGEAMPLGLDRALDPERVERLVLGPLSLAALHHMIQGALGVRLPRPVLVRVEEASRGNPFYALELARAIGQGGQVPGLGDPLPISRVLSALVSDRLNRLSAVARTAASATAALSRPTGTSVAAALGPSVDAEAALAEAEAAGILLAEGDRLRFSHPLLASAIYGSLGAISRRALHRRLAEVVGDPEERARHLARSVTTADEDAATEIEGGAQLAERRGAPQAAAELYEAASRLTPRSRPDDFARRILGGAHARTMAGDFDGARALATRTIETSQAGTLRARALLLLGSLATYAGTIEERIDFQERALVEAGADSDLRVEILLSLFEQISVDPEKAERRANEAIDILREGDRPALLARALIAKFIARCVLGRGADTKLFDEALTLEARSAGPTTSYPLLWFHWIDDADAVRARFALEDQRYRDLGDVVGSAELVEFLAMAEFRAGNWDRAEEALEQACATLAQFELRGPLTASFADRSVIDAHRGRIGRARTTLLGILDGGEPVDRFWRAVCHSAQGAVEFCDGRYEAADRAWRVMREDAEAVGWIDFLDDRSEPDHVEALVALGRLDDARAILDHLEWRGRTLPRLWIDATLPRARASVLATEGNAAAALAALEAAPVIAGLPFERARLLLLKGQIERRGNRKLAAKESLAEALSAFEELGSPPWAERTRLEIGRLGLRHVSPDELTATERRIAELAAGGLTNRQVAEAAFVSPKTVEANLARAYRKLGIGSRAELGALMAAKPHDRSQT